MEKKKKKELFQITKGVSLGWTILVRSVPITLRPSWFCVLIWMLEKARCTCDLLLSHWALAPFVSLLLFNQSFLPSTPCCVFTSVLLSFHLYWASNSWDLVVPSIVCSNPYLLHTYDNQCRDGVWLFTSRTELSILKCHDYKSWTEVGNTPVERMV